VTRSRRDPPSGVSRTVVVAAVALAVALLAPSLSWGAGPTSARRDPAASTVRP
jgi:hypothetical protein